MQHATEPRTGLNNGLSVVHSRGHFRVVATEAFAPGDPVLAIEGTERRQPSRYSVQVAEDVHMEVPEAAAADLHAVFERYPWRFLNHSCAPTAAIRGRTVVAIRPIAPGDEVTFDYNTTELSMATPFECRCGHCGGRTVGGFLHLAPEERARLRPMLAPHLLRRLA